MVKNKNLLLMQIELEDNIEIDAELLSYVDGDEEIVKDFIKYKLEFSIGSKKYIMPVVYFKIGEVISTSDYLSKLAYDFNFNDFKRMEIANFLGEYYENFAVNYSSAVNSEMLLANEMA